MSTNFNKKLTAFDLLDLICYNLAQFSYIEKEYAPYQNIMDYKTFFEKISKRLHLMAKAQQIQIQALTKEKNNETNLQKKEELQQQINTVYAQAPYNINQVATNLNMARFYAKSLLFLGDFDIVLANQKENARPFDSVGGTGILGDSNEISDAYLTHYQEKHSVGPIIDSCTRGSKAPQERVEMLLSLAKPKNHVHHQIWLNDHLMLQANFTTNESLVDALSVQDKKIGDILYLIAYAEEIEKKANGKLTQEFINNELQQIRMRHMKREIEKNLEQYSLLTVELLGQLIKKLKKNNPKIQNSPLYEKLNDINGITRPFTPTEIQKMKDYLTVRDNLAHPTEYNLRPMGDAKNQNLLSDFVTDISDYLANFLNISVSDIQNKINAVKQEESFDVRALIVLMDTRKALRDICLKEENLPQNSQDTFVSLGFINQQENQDLKDALYLRNMLCHGKIDFELAQKAESAALKSWKTINKIASCINKKYGISLKEYYDANATKNIRSLSDFQKEFPFMNTSFETDPDKELFKKAVQKHEKTNKETHDPELLSKLYVFATMLHTHFLKAQNKQITPFVEEEVEPFIAEMDDFLKNKDPNTFPTIKQLVLHGVLKGFEKGHKIPSLKTEHTRE